MLEPLLWIPIAFLGIAIMVIVVTVAILHHMDEEVPAEGEEGATEDWSPREELDRVIADERLGSTGELDLYWFQHHIRFDDIEDRLSRALDAVISKATEALKDDAQWCAATVKTESIPTVKVAIVNTVRQPSILTIPGRV